MRGPRWKRQMREYYRATGTSVEGSMFAERGVLSKGGRVRLTPAAVTDINQSAGATVVRPGDEVTIIDPTADADGFILIELPDGTTIGALPGDFE